MEDIGIARAARRLRIGALLGLGAIILIYLAGRLGLHSSDIFVQTRLGSNRFQIVGDCTVLFLIIAVYRLSQALRVIEKGGFFSTLAIRYFRSFALWLLLMALFSFLAPFLLQLAQLRPDNSPHKLALMISLRDLLLVGITALIFLIARLLERARALEEENREII